MCFCTLSGDARRCTHVPMLSGARACGLRRGKHAGQYPVPSPRRRRGCPVCSWSAKAVSRKNSTSPQAKKLGYSVKNAYFYTRVTQQNPPFFLGLFLSIFDKFFPIFLGLRFIGAPGLIGYDRRPVFGLKEVSSSLPGSQWERIAVMKISPQNIYYILYAQTKNYGSAFPRQKRVEVRRHRLAKHPRTDRRINLLHFLPGNRRLRLRSLPGCS